MSCCDETTARVPDTQVSRRAMFKGAALVSSLLPAAHPTRALAQGKKIRLAFSRHCCASCPTRSLAHAATSTTMGSTSSSSIREAAMRRCRRWSAARSTIPRPRSTSRCRPTANGAAIRRFAIHRPVAAVRAGDGSVARKANRGRSRVSPESHVGVSALGNADHALLLILLNAGQGGSDEVRFAAIGVNLSKRSGRVSSTRAGARNRP